MKYYFITGVSKGIGKALVNDLLKQDDIKIYGYSRTQPDITNNNFEWIAIDLSKTNTVIDFNFPDLNLKKDDTLYLVNNAAIIGDINFTGKKDNKTIADTYNVNIIAPAILTNKFLDKYGNLQNHKIIFNVSSGAGRHPIVSWADYCATKAAMDMLSNTIKEELDIEIYPNTYIFSVAPGIVDTQMQNEIRLAGKEKFPHHEIFVEYKEKNLLWTPETVAEKLIYIMHNPDKFDRHILLDIRDL